MGRSRYWLSRGGSCTPAGDSTGSVSIADRWPCSTQPTASSCPGPSLRSRASCSTSRTTAAADGSLRAPSTRSGISGGRASFVSARMEPPALGPGCARDSPEAPPGRLHALHGVTFEIVQPARFFLAAVDVETAALRPWDTGAFDLTSAGSPSRAWRPSTPSLERSSIGPPGCARERALSSLTDRGLIVSGGPSYTRGVGYHLAAFDYPPPATDSSRVSPRPVASAPSTSSPLCSLAAC
jgi:hypothetical protein